MFGMRRKNSSVLSKPRNFMGFTVPQPKIRIKLPKLLLKSMPRRDNECSCDTNDGICSKNNRSAKGKAKILLPKNFGSIFSKSLGRKKSQELSPSKDDKNGGALEGCIEVPVTTQILPGLQADGDPFLLGQRKPILSISHSFKGMLETLGKFNSGKESEKSTDAGKQALNISFTSQRFLSKSIGFNLTKRKACKTNNDNTDATEDSGDDCLVCEKGSDDHVTGKQRRSKIVPRMPTRKPGGNRKIKSPKFMQKKMMRQGEGTENGHEKAGKMELCKKRILMGGRCRPLNVSGVLHYDENGILLPEEIFPSEEL